MTHRPVVALVVVFALAPLAPAHADPLAPSQVPAPLKPWVGWVLHGHDGDACTHLDGADGGQRCLWPGRLSLSLDEKGGRFTQTWTVEHRAWVPLPGTDTRRPEDVLVDGRSAIVYPAGGAPGVRLEPGTHQVSGRFAWDAMPEKLQVPVATGLVDLTVRGAAVAFPERDGSGRLWLQKRATEGTEKNSLDVTVSRKLTDSVPFEVTTRIDLEVAGENREVTLGRALLTGFIPMSLTGPLPARVEPDGRLKVQVRPGSYTLLLTARAPGPVAKLTLPKPGGPWAASEVWVFDARPDLRLVDLSGLAGVDPAQTRLPDDWKRFPAYQVKPGDTLTLTVRRRGDAEPAPDQLNLDRTLWLDFDGHGFTFHDSITGTLHSGLRLSMAAPSTLGRVSVDGHDQLVTRLTKNGPAGVEVRRRTLNVDADGRYDGPASKLPAVGWTHGFQSVSATLNLPPGWRLLQASGVDQVPSTWLARWTLLDLFLVLVLSLAVARLFGWRFGVLALVTLFLCFTEHGAPRWILAFVLAGEALWRVLPDKWPRRLAGIYRAIVLVVLVGVTVPFLVHQVRAGMYPVLEQDNRDVTSGPVYERSIGIGNLFGASADALAGKAAPTAQKPAASAVDRFAKIEIPRKMVPPRHERSGEGWKQSANQQALSQNNRYEVDPNAVVQTGPGKPIWSWHRIPLTWNGPVAANQTVHLYLLPPGMALVLAFVRVILLTLLVLVLLVARSKKWPRWLTPKGGAAALVLLALALPLAARAQASSPVPPQDVLDQLRTRLLAPPDCLPTCASVPRLSVSATADTLTLRLEIDTAASVAVPLPGSAEHFVPSAIMVDGSKATRLARGSDGQLWIALDKGGHQLLMTGPLPHRDTVQIALPLHPGHTDATLAGWTLVGLHEDGVADDTLELDRIRSKSTAGQKTLEPGVLPDFVVVRRQISLGLDWTVTTTLTRKTPTGSAVVLAVPLLPGESVTTEGLRVEKGKAQVNMAPGAYTATWSSTLKPAPTLVLTAPKTTEWTEVWELGSSPVWHVTAKGIPPVHTANDTPVRVYRPWPGESLTLTVVRPAPVPGRSLTIDHSDLAERPGLRATDATLSLTMRSSRGGPHTVTLPEHATLQSASVGGRTLPLRQDGRKLVLPLLPGSQDVTLTWRESRPMRTRFTTSKIDLGTDSVNAEVHLTMPRNRWVLFLFGPRAGPAVLFWSILIVMVLAAWLLSRVKSPLSMHQWVLLALGLTQTPVWLSIIVVGWLLALGWRKRRLDIWAGWFDMRQILIAVWTLVALVILGASVHEGLLGRPQMQILGNGSNFGMLHWYSDHAAAALPTATVISVPILVYRLAMLLWALWLAVALLGWLKFGWGAFREGGLWRRIPVAVKTPPVAATGPGPAKTPPPVPPKAKREEKPKGDDEPKDDEKPDGDDD